MDMFDHRYRQSNQHVALVQMITEFNDMRIADFDALSVALCVGLCVAGFRVCWFGGFAALVVCWLVGFAGLAGEIVVRVV